MSVPKAKIFEVAGVGRKVVGVVGGTSTVVDVDILLTELSKIAKKNGVIAQVFDADLVAGESHLVHAARLAILARETGRGFTNSLEVELLCWIAGERQIGRAIRKVGIRPGMRKLAFVVAGETRGRVNKALREIVASLGLKPNPLAIALNRKKEKMIKEAFSITPEELGVAPLEKLVMERVSSLELQR
jgi:KEOPS complex subunit Cgi121